MLWALLISLILRNQIRQSKSAELPLMDLKHTPGFYDLDVARLEQYMAAMQMKLDDAVARYNQSCNNLSKAYSTNKPMDVRSAVFFKLCSMDNNVTKSRNKVKLATEDTAESRKIAHTTNQLVDTAYDLAYKSKSELLKYKLSNMRAK